jgi:hypothetical protein
MKWKTLETYNKIFQNISREPGTSVQFLSNVSPKKQCIHKMNWGNIFRTTMRTIGTLDRIDNFPPGFPYMIGNFGYVPQIFQILTGESENCF